VCGKCDSFEEFVFIAAEKHSLNLALSENQFDSVPKDKCKDTVAIPSIWDQAWNHHCSVVFSVACGGRPSTKNCLRWGSKQIVQKVQQQ